MNRLAVTAGLVGSAALSGIAYVWKKPAEHFKDTTPLTGVDLSQYELKLVQVLFRHGARTPLKPIPFEDEKQIEWKTSLLNVPPHTLMDYTVTDLNGGPQPPSPVEDTYRKRKLKGGIYPGQLTTLGMQQLYELGQKLRKRYVEEKQFILPVFSPSEVYVRSTNIVRNIESTRCLLAGLFHQNQEGRIRIVTAGAENEIFYPNYHICRQLKVLGSPRWSKFSLLPSVSEDLSHLHKLLEIKETKGVDFILLRDNLVAMEAHHLPGIPALEKNSEKIKERASEMLHYVFDPQGRKVLQFAVGPLLHLFLENMEMVKNNGTSTSSSNNVKMFLYSTHDTTLVPCMMALGISDMNWPPFGAELTLELYQHQLTKEHYVRVLYLGEDQLVQGCNSVLCPLQEFHEAVAQYTLSPEEYHTNCNQARKADGGQMRS
ncbi:lysophosphatidic acid phosphatase type 6 isoform X2 [Protopterus annectens]|uniref:lysophosphatidic acid phosphatase type 6 isoform X2 n=1 Tax=Protopterus annectens TaxID=7888 RepID=UPI001CFAC551|nr:lysophosphatidic acid phosphatase type 6 isoform X2 [Protopterus annectens]